MRHNGSWRSLAMLEGTKTLATIGLGCITFNPRVMGGRPASAGCGLGFR
jgi:hypothetical protein